MSAKAVPFYQKRHKHFDQSYRNIDTRYVMQEYSSKKRSSASTHSSAISSASASSSLRMSQAKRVRSAADEEALQYTVPTFRKRTQEGGCHLCKGHERRFRFSSELDYLEEDIIKSRRIAREQLDKLEIQRMVEEKMAVERHIHEECISRAPDILVRLRSHTVWERMAVKLFFTVQGFPSPIVQWYKNESLISPATDPGKYRIESKYGVHILEINRTNFNDTATYTAVATNVHGQASTNAAVVVRRFREEEPYHSVLLPIHLPMPPVVTFAHIDVQFLEKFGVTFGVEGDTLGLTCSMLITPDLTRLQPRAEWYRDDVLVHESKWTELFYGQGRATLSFTHLNKDDEGLYTLRMVTRGGVNEYSAFLFVADSAALVAGAPGAPMDVECHDANKDYVILTWKPPNTASESAVIGYFIDRCEVGTENWIQCNDSPVKICKYPVSGLYEGRSYIFRVRAVNKAGVSRPSRVSVAVAALDPADLARLQTIHYGEGKEIVIYQDDLEGDVKVPGPPTNVNSAETSKTYIVLSWEPPVPRGREPLVYYVEKSMVGSGSWQRVNSQIPVRSPRFAVFDMAAGKSYNFRVLSVNKHGVSEPSEITAPIQAEDIIAIPSAPGRILATRNTKTSVVVQWDRPKQEEELIGYYIDSSVVGSNHWESCNHKPISYSRFVVHGLITGEKYIFRVKAVNAVGVSENSQESEAISVQAALTTPSFPYGITLLNCDGHSMTLGWKVPRFSGGSKINGYYIDKREVNHRNWHEVNTSAIKQRLFTVEELTEGALYEYKIAACNLAGMGQPSDASDHFNCEAWTMPEPGPSYDLTFCEVRNSSLVILWKAPVYTGKSPVTGYFVDYKEVDSESWTTVNKTATESRYLKILFLNGNTGLTVTVPWPNTNSTPNLLALVKELEEGKTYVFQIRAVNASGIGRASDVSEPVLVQARPGTEEITTGVDEEGNIYLSFNCKERTDASQFTWCKSYEEIQDESKFSMETIVENSKLYFKNPEKSDLGTYSVAVSDTEGISSSYVMDADAIPLKSELSYEIFEKGQVRFWMQAESLSAESTYRFVVNDGEVKDSESHRIKCDKSTGLIEMVMDRFTIENEGTYTVQIEDGKAKSQSSLVLIGEAFKAVLAEAEFQRKEFLRKQGPYFLEYLSWEVTEECVVVLACKVANTKKESVFRWYKDDVETVSDEAPNMQAGVCTLPIMKLSKKDQGVYKATLTDDRGQDVSTLEIAGKVFEDIILEMSRVCGASASQLQIVCTAEGVRFHCNMKFYAEEMKVSWYQKDKKISSSEKMRIGGTDEYAWLQICEPTDKDKGKYTFELFDGKQSHKRDIDLSGQAFDEAFAEFQKLKQAAFAEKNRGKVVGGLPDVVTIMDGKTLTLTCTVFGNPPPEVSWLKNDRDLELNDHFLALLDEQKYATLTITGVSSDDSGKYGIYVRNKHGGETVDVTVSVYKHGEEMPEIKPPLSSKPSLVAPVEQLTPAPKPAPSKPAEKAKAPPKFAKSGRK